MHGSLVTLATCNLNQWAMDFDGNLDRIIRSCQQAKALGASYRLGPELEICGYGCEDHFFEQDTMTHCWESLFELLDRGATNGILCDFGMPILHQGVRYNCRVLVHNKKILLIRPKAAMADGGNYRESRYFTAFPQANHSHQQCLLLPEVFFQKFGQREAPFGLYSIQCGDATTVGCESCEELWTPESTHIGLALRGVEIIGNASGSHHELRKLHSRVDLIRSATQKAGGIYVYANQRGCDGGRLYFDGCAMICANGNVLAQAPQFHVGDVQVIVATVDLDEVRSYRASIPSLGMQARKYEGNYIKYYDIRMTSDDQLKSTMPLPEVRYHSPQEECCLGPACWLWDYLRRSGATGFFLPLSGGADSSAVATIVGAMCAMVTEAAKVDPDVASECRRICRKGGDWIPETPQELAGHVLYTTFMGTDNSSQATESRAKRLGDAIGSYHISIQIDVMVSAILQVFWVATGKKPKFSSQGGSISEDLALQNIQARLRMVTAYLFAQLWPWVRGRSGFLLVLGSANVDEGLRGYMTKYDCSSADLNPIGAMSKGDLKRMLLWASQHYKGFEVLAEIAGAPPTAELRPMASSDKEEHSQLDEEEMGMTYEELGVYGKLRKICRCGPVGMFRRLCVEWAHLSPTNVAEKVKKFFYYYSINRHKMCTITPAYHAEGYSPDDNRFDLRQFLYNTSWPRQFRVIDELAEKAEQYKQKKGK